MPQPENKIWSRLEIFSRSVWICCDDLWKIWRWMGLGLLGFAAYEGTDDMGPLVFGIAASLIGLASAVFRLVPLFISGVTEKGKKSGLAWTALILLILGFLSMYFSLVTWIYVANLAFPAFDRF